MLVAPRLIFSLAENRLLPNWFAHINRKYATPDRAILIMGIMALVLGLSSNFVDLAIGSSVVRLLGYIVCILALPAVRRQAKPAARERAFRLPGGYAIPLAALGICAWLLVQSRLEDWFKVLILLGIGISLYAVEKWVFSRRDARH